MRPRGFGSGLLSAAVLLSVACASRTDGKLPTYEEYSDGTSTWAEDFLAGWRSGAVPGSLFSPEARWNGPLPGDALAPIAAAAPLRVAAFSAGVETPGPSGATPADIRYAFDALRRPLATLGRCEATIVGFGRRGSQREIRLAVFLSGRGAGGELRQTGGVLGLDLEPSGTGWRMASGRVESWLAASAAQPLFDNVAEKAGLTRPHRAYLPNAAKNVPVPGEHLPPGAAVLDYDGDGLQDIFVCSGDGNRLYRNRGDGTFEDAATRAGVAGQEGEATGALAFDYDNDGRQDLYVTYLFRPNLLFRNRGDGTFEEVGVRAGVGLNEYSTSSAALDYDRDGRPDLYVLVYGHPDHGPTLDGDNAPPNHLYRNNGDGTFTDVSQASGADDHGWGLALQSADFDGDGWPDIYVANDFGNHAYLHNERQREVPEHGEEGRSPRSRLRHGCGRRRLRRRRTARLLRFELLVSAQLVPQGPALPDAALPVLARPSLRLAPPHGPLARVLPLPQSWRRPLRAHVRGGRRRGHLLVLGMRVPRCGSRRASGPLRRQRHGDGEERDRARNRLLEPHVGRVQEVREGHPHRRVRRRLALGPAAQALLPQPRRPPFRRARRGGRARIGRQPARPRRRRRQLRTVRPTSSPRDSCSRTPCG